MGSIDWNAIVSKLITLIPPFEVRLGIIVFLIVLLCMLNVRALLHRRKNRHLDHSLQKKITPIKTTQHREPKKHGLKTLLENPRLLLRTNIAVTLLCVLIIGSLLFIRPIVIGTSPRVGTTLANAQQEIGVEFDIPIDPEKLTFHISPEIQGNWEFQRTVSSIPVVRKAIFHPEESFYPGNPVVIYITGIQTLSGAGKFHELALEFSAPHIPLLVEITPAPGSQDVKTDATVTLTYDAPIGDFVETTIQIEPAAEFVVSSKNNEQILTFLDGLAQDTQYTLKAYQTPRSYDIATGENIEVGETKELGQTTFTTVLTPGITEYEPKGDGVLVDSPIRVVFDQNMNTDSVSRHFSITPDVEGTISWDDEKSFVFTPQDLLQKETSYTITFSKGMYSETEGTIPEDVVLTFTTIGRVNIVSISPVPGSYGVDPTTANVIVVFNQAVDQSSAQEHFSVTPSVSGGFSWDGNIMTYATAGKLAYSTTYIVTLTPGIISTNGLDSTETFTYSFATRSNTFTLNVPLYLQAPGFTCNLVATKMVLAYRGISVGVGDVQNGIGLGGDPNTSWVDGYGTHWGPISRYIGQYRQTAAKQGWTLSEILHEVQNGNPVILFWYNRYSQPPGAYTLPSGATAYMGMHSEVVRGFVGSVDNPSAILVNDPWRGHLSYSPSLFVSNWAYIGYAAVVVY